MYDYEGKCSHNAHNSHSSQKRLVRRRSTIKVTSSGMTHLCRKTKKKDDYSYYSINALDFNKKMTTIKKKLGRATYKTVTLESEISVEGRENEKNIYYILILSLHRKRMSTRKFFAAKAKCFQGRSLTL